MATFKDGYLTGPSITYATHKLASPNYTDVTITAPLECLETIQVGVLQGLQGEERDKTVAAGQ